MSHLLSLVLFLPLAGALLLLFVLFVLLGQPIAFARRAYHRDVAGGWVLAAWDGILWLGFLVACLVWFLVGRLRPLFARLRDRMRYQAGANRSERASLDEIRLGNDTGDTANVLS